MIHGVGVDVVHLPRFEKFARDHAGRLGDLFRPEELAAHRSRRALASAWALKEAVLKSIGGLDGWGVDWREIRVGAKGIRLAGQVAKHAKKLRVGGFETSTSAVGDAIFATVIAIRG